MSKTTLITGGAGYIGSHAVKKFLEQGHHVVVLDNFPRGYREPLHILKKYGHLDVFEGDLKDYNSIVKVFTKYAIDTVLHFAGFCSVNESIHYPELYFENNTLGSYNLLKGMHEHAVHKLIFSSTCAVYGNAQYVPVDESHPLAPLSPYGESKLMTERMIEWFGKGHDLRYVILRYFNVCGTSTEGIIGDSRRPSEALMQNAIRGAMNIEPFSLTCEKVNTHDGSPIRDYVDVEDLIDAHLLMYEYLWEGGKSEIFNVGTERGHSVLEVISEVEKALCVKLQKLAGKPRNGESERIFASSSRINKASGWTPKKQLQESVESLVRWYRGKPKGYDHLVLNPELNLEF